MLHFRSDDGRVLPITNMFDVDNVETSDPALAVVVVASLPSGHWLATQVYEGEIVEIDRNELT